MKILFYSSKGGQGKTTHAISYAKHRGALYFTNDYESGTVEIYKDIFPEDQLHIIRNEDSLNLPVDLDVVFDFGGWVDERIESIAKICDVLVVPLFYQSMADLMPCIKTVNTLKGLNENVVILINNTDKKDVDDLKKGLNKKFPERKIFVVNKSKFIPRLANEGKTIDRLSNENPLNRYLLSGLLSQLNEFYNYLDNSPYAPRWRKIPA
ncbi:MAG: hypothetical protein CDV28_1382 [Candidatus Electronema aureum]|uniref:CobQ/CobB/MinD/ParA nucleotide binding domain-containing protein n=1 Tax=Candidatus Electronema aureum TaxID=2005002 RepID=A0A521FZD0_9BACT|nr:MAG: hypothetical protein CDV28_1382 [Candidatus Electronema aureum]